MNLTVHIRIVFALLIWLHENVFSWSCLKKFILLSSNKHCFHSHISLRKYLSILNHHMISLSSIPWPHPLPLCSPLRVESEMDRGMRRWKAKGESRGRKGRGGAMMIDGRGDIVRRVERSERFTLFVSRALSSLSSMREHANKETLCKV